MMQAINNQTAQGRVEVNGMPLNQWLGQNPVSALNSPAIRLSGVESGISNLMTVLESIRTEIDVLSSKLAPVLLNVLTTGEVDAQTPERPKCQVASQLDDLFATANLLRYRINELTQKIDL